MIFEYGVMRKRYSLKVDDKLTAYATMVTHIRKDIHLIQLCEPQEIVKDDSWFANPFTWVIPIEQTIERLDEIFGGKGSFEKYIDEHQDEIRAAYSTIKQITL